MNSKDIIKIQITKLWNQSFANFVDDIKFEKEEAEKSLTELY